MTIEKCDTSQIVNAGNKAISELGELCFLRSVIAAAVTKKTG